MRNFIKRNLALCIAVVVLAVFLCPMFSSCGNMDIIGIGTYTFKYVHIINGGNGKCVEIRSWINNDSNANGIEVTLTDGTGMFFSEGSYYLSEDKCPLCK